MAQTLTAQSGQTVLLATFFVRGALCALDATEVQEVIRLGPVTPVRYAPEAVLGIVNLRGKIVTIVDLGLRLGLPQGSARKRQPDLHHGGPRRIHRTAGGSGG